MTEAMSAGGRQAAPSSTSADRSAKLWYAAFRREKAGRETVADVVADGGDHAARSVGDIAVRVWLFGILATLIDQRPVVFNMETGFSATDVIDELARSCGAGCSDEIARQLAEIVERGRIFVDGYPVEDMGAPLDVKRPSAEVEIILLVAYEGG